MHSRPIDRGDVLPFSRIAFVISVVIVAVTFIGVAAVNRLPVLFPDTVGYSSAGESVLAALGGHDHRRNAAATAVVATTAAVTPAAPAAVGPAPPSRADTGISEARSPYYGLVLALVDRVGGVWLAAAAQALVAAAALLLAVRRLGLRGMAAAGTIAVAMVAGLAFYACVMIPDVFLGPAILALAFLFTAKTLPRGERAFWLATLLAALLFHRGFLAVGLVIVAVAALAWRAAWFVRRGWAAAAACVVAAALAHAAVAPVVGAVYGAKMASQPFVLARMVEGTVVPAYLDDACPTTSYYLCRLRGRLPMDHQQFLWAGRPAGVFNVMSFAERKRVNQEANAIVVGAVAARPVAALAEAAGYAVRSFFVAGMDDFSQRVPTRWYIDPPLVPAMAAYPSSGIVAGDFPLHGFSRVTEIVYLTGLAVLAAAALTLARPAWVGRRRTGAVDRRLIAAVAVIVAGLVINAAVSGVLSGIQDRYTGRIAWLAPVAAAALLGQALAATGPGRAVRDRTGRHPPG